MCEVKRHHLITIQVEKEHRNASSEHRVVTAELGKRAVWQCLV